ncbi:MAG TPA: choline ABC transporter substrate-binding protein [Candidatus Competibacteraceae bacterium]|nr:choline ABC transporter substrate-binding protein [Candidatus Competibacteraceae bacterium]
MRHRKLLGGLAAALALTLSTTGHAADPASCQTVRFSDPGWTDIASTNALAGVVLESLGYRQQVQILAVPVGFQSMKNQDIDVFLGNWMPAQTDKIDAYLKDGSIEVVGENLAGAKFTLAVNKAAFEAGVKDFADLAKYAERFGGQIYGIESGAPANLSLRKMIDANDFGLGKWRLVESSEQAMLSQVKRRIASGNWIVFLAWEPHPMNTNFEIRYLTGGDKYFGPDFGGATVHTVVRKGYLAQCPNVGKLLKNMRFTLEMENQMMGLILDHGLKPNEAARKWLAEHPQVLDSWLKEVTTLDGQPALPAVQVSLRQ